MATKTDKISGLDILPETRNLAQSSEKNWKTTSKGIVFEKKCCHLNKKAKVIAVILGFALAGCLIGSLYFFGVFNDAPDFEDTLEGEADLSTDDGGKEIYNLKIDFSKKIIQMTFMKEMHDGNYRQRRDVNLVEQERLNFSKIVVQNFAKKKKYFIIPGKNGTTKCLAATLTGEMLPKDLLKHAKNEQIPNEVKQRVIQRLRFGDDSEADVMVPNENETQNLVYKGIGFNMSMHTKKRESLGMVDVDNIKCFEYKEETNEIEKEFYSSDQSKFVLENLSELQNKQLKSIAIAFNETNVTSSRRHRRSILDKFTRWSHGNWCGAYTGGYENHCKRALNVCKAPYQKVSDACKKCNPPIDRIDSHCMEHDRCLMEHGPGPSGCLPQGNRCSCDHKLFLGAVESGISCANNGHSECVSAASTIGLLFSTVLSCWFPSEVCFPSVKIVCGCSACSCPSMKFVKTCVSFKFCVPFGSGKVPW